MGEPTPNGHRGEQVSPENHRASIDALQALQGFAPDRDALTANIWAVLGRAGMISPLSYVTRTETDRLLGEPTVGLSIRILGAVQNFDALPDGDAKTTFQAIHGRLREVLGGTQAAPDSFRDKLSEIINLKRQALLSEQPLSDRDRMQLVLFDTRMRRVAASSFRDYCTQLHQKGVLPERRIHPELYNIFYMDASSEDLLEIFELEAHLEDEEE